MYIGEFCTRHIRKNFKAECLKETSLRAQRENEIREKKRRNAARKKEQAERRAYEVTLRELDEEYETLGAPSDVDILSDQMAISTVTRE